MNCTLVPSLQHTSLIKVAVSLWIQDDIRTLVEAFNCPLSNSKCLNRWQNIQNEVSKNALELILPETLKNKIIDFIKPVGLQILEWMEHHFHCKFIVSIKLPVNLIWTSRGTVDKKKTAEILVKDENLDITERYKLACFYCLENEISLLWSRLAATHKISLYDEVVQIFRPRYLVTFWTYYSKGEMAIFNNMISSRVNCSAYQHAFEVAAICLNRVAVEYFLVKLTSEEREEVLVKFATFVASGWSFPYFSFARVGHIDLLCFLLSQMNEEQRMKVFVNYPDNRLKNLLDRPWQDIYVQMAEIMWKGPLPM